MKEKIRPAGRTSSRGGWVAVLLVFLFAAVCSMEGCRQARLGSTRCFGCDESIGIAPDPRATEEALVQIYAARAYRWRAIFAVHTWIALKTKGAPMYTLLQVTGWWPYPEEHPMRVREVIHPDRQWHGADPDLVYELRGQAAEEAIPKIRDAVKRYPHLYQVWPGPNSNTFTAFVVREVPELKAELPPTAVGKDYLLDRSWWARTPNGWGFQVSLGGLLGFTVGIEEGFELNVLGLTLGLDMNPPALKLPVIGRLGRPQTAHRGG